MQIEPSKARILADCIEGMAADAEDKGKDSFGIHLSLEDARMITRSLSAAIDRWAKKQPSRIRFFALRRWLKEMPRKEDFYEAN